MVNGYKTPNPGSNEALDKGCLCPVLSNAHGRGVGGDGEDFWINGDCPIHGNDVLDLPDSDVDDE